MLTSSSLNIHTGNAYLAYSQDVILYRRRKKTKQEILDLKIMVTEIKNSLEGFKGRFEQAEESAN